MVGVALLVLFAVVGWAAAFGPLKEQARALLKAETEEPVIDRGPRPIDPASSGTSAKPAWLIEKEAAEAELAAQKAWQQEIEAAANDPERQKLLLEIDAQIRQLDALEAEQRLLKVEARQGRATGEANSKKIDDLQKQIDDLKHAIDTRKHPGAPGADSENVQVVRDEKSARAAAVGYLSLRTINPASAAVYLEDTSLGSTPLVKVPLEAGVHRLRVVDGEGKARVFSVRIEPGKTNESRPLDVSSLPPEP